MAMQGAGILELVAELSVAILGFSGVVVALGRRASGVWSPVDRLRFLGMIRAAAVVLVLSLLPFPFHAAGHAGAALWAKCSGIGAVFLVAFIVLTRFTTTPGIERTAWSDGSVSRLALAYTIPAFIGTPVLLGLNALGLLFDRTFTPYLSGVLLLFGVSVIFFLRLLLSSFQHDEHAA